MIRPRTLPRLLVLLPVVAAIAALLFVMSSSNRSLAVLERLVAIATPYRLTLEDAHISWLPLRFDARQIVLEYPDDTKPALLQARGLELAMPMSGLWAPRYDTGRFRARSLTYYLDDEGSDEPLDLESLLSPLAWLPARVEADAVHLVSRGERVQVLPLLSLRGERTTAGSLNIDARTYLGERSVALAAVLDWRSTPGGHAVDLVARLRDAASTLALEGRMQAQESRLAYDIDLRGVYAHAGDFWRLLALPDPAPQAELAIDGNLAGDRSGGVLTLRQLSLVAPERFEFTAHGELGLGPTPALRIEARGRAAQLEALFPMPEALRPLVRETAVSLSLRGTPAAPVLRELALDLRHAGAGSLHLASEDLTLEALMTPNNDGAPALRFDRLRLDGTAGDLPALIEAAGMDGDIGLRLPDRAELSGVLALDGGRMQLYSGQLVLGGVDYRVAGPVDLLWQDGVLSLRDLDLQLSVPGHRLTGTIQGAVADVGAQRGAIVQLNLEHLEGAALQRILARPPAVPPGLTGNVSLRLLKAADVTLARDIEMNLSGDGGLSLHLQGKGRVAPTWEADLEVDLAASEPATAFGSLGLPLGPERGEGRIRVRERYATLLGELWRGTSSLQLAVNADLAAGAVEGLRVDLYTPAARLEDFTPPDAPRDPSATGGRAAAPGALSLPDWPLVVTLRAGQLRGQRSSLEKVSIEVEADSGDLLLKHFDARYAGGELILRGLAHVEPPPAVLSLGGRGIRVPLGALTQDLGLQQSISGELSFRGALMARGDGIEAWTRTLSGQAGIVISNAVVSGRAYDLLMSNLLAWLVQGSGERTTTFDCTLLDFDIGDGVAESRSFVVDTARMRAEGRARVDLAGDRIDLRLEPRSKDRLVQFPSAVRLSGPLASPRVDVSGLQATADLSAQALLLLPSLPLKLLGLGADGRAPEPCVMSADP